MYPLVCKGINCKRSYIPKTNQSANTASLLLLVPPTLLVAPEFSLANKPSHFSLSNNLTASMIPNTTSARPEDDAYNIQRGCPTSRTSTNGLRSTFPSPMDNSSPPSEVDYAERVAANCNMDIEIMDPSLPLAENTTNFSFSLPASDSRVPPEAVPNPAVTGYSDLSTEPSPPEVIPYNANVPADPSL